MSKDILEFMETCEGLILFKMPVKNKWSSKFSGQWIAAKNLDVDYLCATDSYIDTQLTGQAGKTAEEALQKLKTWLQQ